MCQFKSALILKDRVFVPDYDSHEDMIRELNLLDDTNTPNFVRVELSPVSFSHKDILALSEWEYIVDQDYLPDWYVPSYDEQRARAAISEWFDAHCWKADQEDFPDIDMQKESTYFIFGKHRLQLTYNVTETTYQTSHNKNGSISCYIGSTPAPVIYLYDNSTINVDGYMTGSEIKYIILYDTAAAFIRDATYCFGYDNSSIYAYGKTYAWYFDKSNGSANDRSFIYIHSNGDFVLRECATAMTYCGDSPTINARHCSRVIKCDPNPAIDEAKITLHDSAVCQVFNS